MKITAERERARKILAALILLCKIWSNQVQFNAGLFGNWSAKWKITIEFSVWHLFKIEMKTQLIWWIGNSEMNSSESNSISLIL